MGRVIICGKDEIIFQGFILFENMVTQSCRDKHRVCAGDSSFSGSTQKTPGILYRHPAFSMSGENEHTNPDRDLRHFGSFNVAYKRKQDELCGKNTSQLE